MSSRIRVRSVVGEAFRIGAERWPAFLRFFWLPTLLSALLIGGLMWGMIDFRSAEAAGPVATLEELQQFIRAPLPVFAALLALAYLIAFILQSGGLASFFRLVVLGENRRGLFQLRADGAARRVLWSFAIIVVIETLVFALALAAALCVLLSL